MASVKINVTVDEKLLNRADVFADDNYMSRSGLFSLALTQYLNQNDLTRSISDLAVTMRKIADSGKISDEDKKNLKDFEYLAQLITGERR